MKRQRITHETQNLQKKNIFLKFLIFIFPILFIIFTSPHSELFENSEYTYNEFVQEDGVIEYLTSFFYLGSFVFAVLSSKNFFKTSKKILGITYLILGIIFFIGGMDELSWGQRIFAIPTPDIFFTNIQGELNFHNLDGINNNIIWIFFISGFYGTFSWIFLQKRENYSYNLFVRFFVPKWYFVVFFIPFFLSAMINLLAYVHLWDLRTFIVSEILLYHLHEFFEFFLSAGVLFFVLSVFIKSRSFLISNH